MHRIPTLRVVVVDDFPDAAESLAQVLELFGCKAITIIEPEEALGVILETRPHIVFLDVAMPRITGYDVARGVRERLDAEATQIVGISGYANLPSVESAAREAGFDTLLLKPINLRQMEALLRKRIESLLARPSEGDAGK